MTYSMESEQAVLAALKLDNTVYDKLNLKPSDFAHPRNAQIFNLISHLIECGEAADDITITELSRKNKTPIDVVYLASLDTPLASNAEHHAGIVKEYSNKRQLEKLLLHIRDGLKEKGSEDIIEDIEKAITEIADGVGGECRYIDEILPAALEDIEKRYQARGGYTGICSGFRDLDNLTNGFQNGELIVIAARASIGKTAIAINMASHMALREKKRVGMFSCEMNSAALVNRMIACEGNVNLMNIRSGMMQQSDFQRIQDMGNRFFSSHIMIDDTANIKIMDLRSRARRMRRNGMEIIFIDYLTLISHPNKQLPRWAQVGEISKSLKQLARELDIPIIALSQVGRAAEGQEPNMAHLRQSGEIEEDADVIILLHKKRDVNDTKLIVAKNRNGPCGAIDLVFVPKYTRFVPVEKAIA